MIRRMAAVAVLHAGLLLAAGSRAAEPMIRFSAPRSDYLLACGGCHGLNGVSNERLVPSLKGLVGYYLNLPEGRAYLSRLPNVAFSAMSDEKLAALLNYTVFELGKGSVPMGAKPYGAAEVGKYRRMPLNEVALTRYRREMVETLIARYQAPAALRAYGEEVYDGH